MQYPLLRKLRERPFFAVKDLEALLGIQRGSARLFCHRYTKAGHFIRLKKNFYILAMEESERQYYSSEHFGLLRREIQRLLENRGNKPRP